MSLKQWALMFGAVCLILTLGLGTISGAFSAPEVLAQASPTLPPTLWPKIRADLAQRAQRPESLFKLRDYSPQTWPDSCLGLPQAEEFCAQTLVSGWLLRATDGKTTWIYRANQNGAVFRLAP